MKNQDVFRSEYGRDDRSFLIKIDDYRSVLNSVHRISFE
jgi:hypothetical protein